MLCDPDMGRDRSSVDFVDVVRYVVLLFLAALLLQASPDR